MNFFNKNIIVNHHYVEDPSKNLKGIHHFPIDDFDKHISFLSKNLNVISIPEVYQPANKGSSEKSCVITFDDCLKD